MRLEMQLVINGKQTQIERAMTIAEFLDAKGLAAALVAVEHNGIWLRREDWSDVALKESDRLEIVRVMAGG
jgi:sulfur carrier protein